MTRFNEPRQLEPETLAACTGVACDEAHGAVMPPLFLSSNYSFDGFGAKRAYDYSRSGNPTRDVLGEALAALEEGAGAVVVSSGMAAIDLVLNLVEPGQTVIAPHDCYGGTWRLLNARAKKGAFELKLVDQSDFEALEAELSAGSGLVLIETPSNPLMRVVDVAAICALAKAKGWKTAADNTFLSPALQKPIRLGADLVIHSTTKYLNGHSDVVGGAVVAKSKADHEQLVWWANCTGVTGSPFDAYLTLRGVRTLFARIERQQATAQALAERLAAHPAVAKVHYPGLADHPGHAIAKKQQLGFGAMLSFELAEGLEGVRELVDRLQLFVLAESLGGVESLIAHPATMTHASMATEARERAGITDGLVRVSVGLEHVEDLWRDLEQALDGAGAELARPRLVRA
jgi:cystathionine gamma-synthase